MNFTEFLYRALESEVGIAISTSDPDFLRQKLYTARREAKDPRLEALTFSPSRVNPKGELWIVKKGLPNGRA